jgi:RHS repeat-associated protein
LTRVYRSQAKNSNGSYITNAFGYGWNLSYNLLLTSESYNAGQGYQNVDVVLADGGRIFCNRTSTCTQQGCTDYTDAVFECIANPVGPWFGAEIDYDANLSGWDLTRKDGTVYKFGLAAPLQSVTDRYGNQVTLTRNRNEVSQISDSNGRYINLTYTSGLVTKATDSAGRSTSYSYTSSTLTSATDADGNSTSYAYSSTSGQQGELATISDPLGNFTKTIDYDGNNRLSLLQAGAICAPGLTYSYNTNAQGVVTDATVGFDPGCRLGNTVRHVYFDGNGYLTEDIKAPGLPEQQTATFTRDPNTELITSVTDQLGRVTDYFYDSLGNITSVTRLAGTPQAVTTSYTYDPVSDRVASVTDPLNNTWSATFDSQGNVTAVQDPLGDTTGATYNAQGQPLSVTDPANNKYQYSYTSAGDLASLTDPISNTFTLTSDSAGRVTAFKDALRNSASFTYDAMNRLTQVTDANGNATTFTYDADGDLTLVQDANGPAHQTSYTYSTSTYSPTVKRCSNGNRCFTSIFDPLFGTLTSLQDGRGLTSTFSYDHLQRLTNVQFNSGNKSGFNQTSTSYAYDGGNRLTSASDSGTGSAGDTVTRTYDGLDDLLSESIASPGLNSSVSYTYDNAQRRLTMTAGLQPQTSYSYDSANRLLGISQGSQSVTIVPDSDGRPSTVTLPNGVTVSYGYDARSLVTSISYGSLGGLTYAYDADGRRVSMGGSLAATNLPSAITASYDRGNQVSYWNGTGANTDANGNLTTDPSIAGTYTWNERNQLASAVTNSASLSFAYDALGRRIQVAPASNPTNYVYDGFNGVEEQNSSGSATADMLGGGLDDWMTRTDSSGTNTMLRDGINSTVGLVTSSGSLATQFAYEPFGRTTFSGSGSSNLYRFAGRELDATGLYFMRARYYNPVLQRFLSPDFGGSDVSPYVYAHNSPTNFIDPLGTEAIAIGSGFPMSAFAAANLNITSGLTASVDSLDQIASTGSGSTANPLGAGGDASGGGDPNYAYVGTGGTGVGLPEGTVPISFIGEPAFVYGISGSGLAGPAYTDVNVTYLVPVGGPAVGVGVTGGVQFDRSNQLHGYIGVAVGMPAGFSTSTMGGTTPLATGFAAGVTVAMGGVGVQRGYSLRGGGFTEVGPSFPGVTASVYYVF